MSMRAGCKTLRRVSAHMWLVKKFELDIIAVVT